MYKFIDILRKPREQELKERRYTDMTYSIAAGGFATSILFLDLPKTVGLLGLFFVLAAIFSFALWGLIGFSCSYLKPEESHSELGAVVLNAFSAFWVFLMTYVYILVIAA